MSSVRELIAQRNAHAARTVVLLPYAQLMPLARRLWSQQMRDGFAPRFETTMDWGRRLGFAPGHDDLSFDMARDILAARTWLERAGLDAKGDLLAGRLVEAAWQLGGLAAAVPVGERSAWAAQARAAVSLGAEAPALQLEAAVGRIAVEWAAASSYASDTLLNPALTQAIDLMIVMEGFQAEPIAQALKGVLGDKAVAIPLDQHAPRGDIRLHEAADPSHEAEMAAACVVRHIEAGRVPVALAAIDRVLTRRVRAILGARDIAIRDETGWKLSTTRAASHLMGALRACAWNAASNEVVDFLKNAPAVPPRTASALERRVRREGLREWRSVASLQGPEDARWLALIAQANAWRESMQHTHTLAAWLEALRGLLQACGHWPRLESDAAGAQLIDVLGLAQDMQAWEASPHAGRRWSLSDFTAWVNEVLEAATFKPAHPEAEQVVILPFHQLLGRMPAALVLAGCDEQRLAASPEPTGPWTAAQRNALGLPSREALEAQVRAGWRNALQTPHCDVLWRRSDDAGEPVLASSLVQALRIEGLAVDKDDPREHRRVQAQPVAKPLPASAHLPIAQLSASAYEDLRHCPYRFFSLRQLGLQEAAEIDSELDKRDFGNWLHQVLSEFHDALKEAPAAPGPERTALLDEMADKVTRARRLDEGEFLPFRAAWPQARDGYLEWLAKHEAMGAVFDEAESEQKVQLGPVQLIGRIDRIDRMPDGSRMVMDYKSGSRASIAQRIRQPGEDTQLAFYAALLEDDTLRAAYVNIGERGKTDTLEHKSVVEARDLLVHGILHDLGQVAGGASMPALGEGKVCEYCAARGLCRRDWWVE